MDFYEFIADFGIISLSISTALGLAFHDVVRSISREIFIPLIGYLFNTKNFKNIQYKVGHQTIDVGSIISSILTYISILLIVIFLGYFVFHNLIKKITDLKKKHDQQLLEEQRKTSDSLAKLYHLEAQQQGYLRPGNSDLKTF
jgi:large-conductance mechanosensitive channel